MNEVRFVHFRGSFELATRFLNLRIQDLLRWEREKRIIECGENEIQKIRICQSTTVLGTRPVNSVGETVSKEVKQRFMWFHS